MTFTRTKYTQFGRWPRLVGLCAIAGLAGCTGSISNIERDPISYQPPAGATRGITPISVASNSENVDEVISNSLTLAGFVVDSRPEHNLIVATYQGPPDRYIDCGSLETRGVDRRPAAQRTLTVAAREPAGVRIERTLDLYARAAIELEGGAGATTVDPQVDYVVVKNVNAYASSGELVSSNPEVMSFTSNSSGRFDIGTVCRSNGVLEGAIAETVNAAFQAQPTVIASTRSPLAQPERCATGATAEYCELVDFILARDWRDDVGVSLLGGAQTVTEGEQLVLDIEVPPDLPVVSVSYVDVYGQVVNLKPVELQGGLRRSAFVTRAEVAPPFGEEMIVVVAGNDPEFSETRPFTETVESFADYLDTLNLTAGEDVALNFVTVTTQPSS